MGDARGTFVYGTLRTGHALEYLMPAEGRELVRVRGRLWHRFGDGHTYPVMTIHDVEDGDEVIGELVPGSPWAHGHATAVEVHAGYTIDVVRLTDGREAFAFCWPTDRHGPRIRSGDWRNP